MNPSSLGIDISTVQRQKDMNRNRLGDELGETNKLFGSQLIDDEGSPSTTENIISARQQPERSGAHESDEGGE